MNSFITSKELYSCCNIPYEQIENHPGRKVAFRMVQDSDEMGRLMAIGASRAGTGKLIELSCLGQIKLFLTLSLSNQKHNHEKIHVLRLQH